MDIVLVASISSWSRHRAVANILVLSCRVYATNVRGIVQQGSSFSFRGLRVMVAGENPRPLALGDSPAVKCVLTCGVNHTWRRTSASFNYERFVVTK